VQNSEPNLRNQPSDSFKLYIEPSLIMIMIVISRTPPPPHHHILWRYIFGDRMRGKDSSKMPQIHYHVTIKMQLNDSVTEVWLCVFFFGGGGFVENVYRRRFAGGKCVAIISGKYYECKGFTSKVCCSVYR
jgi:hypothetical protein